MLFITKIIGKTCPFRESPVMRKGRGQTRRGYYEKIVPERSGENYIA